MRRSRELIKKKHHAFRPPLTVTHAELLSQGSDDGFRETIYTMVQALGRLQTCREAFGRALDLTGSQFAVLFGAAYRQGTEGISIRALADYVHLAPTHVTTEVGRLIQLGLLVKQANKQDRRGVLVRLSPKGEAAIARLAPFLQNVNNLLFRDVRPDEYRIVAEFFRKFILNTELALAEIRRNEYERRSEK
jgi:DNA-binding MarR family transcriptional regulator